ncbi:hypothetical protein GH5_03921 [Leishmania sp. Ghana 2012 LV757]|uniref:hypothetical protein n=1 Tax=Leishmania sp. Ghana 2012 LV757 TaxID=2803181 RepID=UPI001B56B85D|nr:hypothetical protein GH5_03921 [Leishmania sp. Ghana 2012 LV757]
MDNYDVLEVIGEGTYGVVFKCRDRQTNQIVAVKQFKNFQTNAYVRIAMLRELRVEQMLKGEPNVTQLLEAFKQKSRLYLVMEYIPRSLLDVLEEQPHGLPEDSLVVLLFTILLGIRSCHRNGIVHRDVKPENILVRDDGTASLCDFGFCRPLPQQLPQQPHQLAASSQDTGALAAPMAGSSSVKCGCAPSSDHLPRMRDGASVSSANSAILSELVFADHQAIMTNYVATRWYRSPEMLLGMSSYTYAVDMWAVGAIMAEAIDGEPLLPGKTELEQLSLIQTRIGDFPAAYEAAVRKRNGGILRLRSLNPLAVPPQQLHTTTLQPKSQRTSDLTGDAPDNTEAKQSTSCYLANRYGGRIAKAGINLLYRLLRIDAAERITVEEALEHPYFDDVRRRLHITASGAHAAGKDNGCCCATSERPAITKERTGSTAPLTATSSCQEPLLPHPATEGVHSTSPFLSASGVGGDGGSRCSAAEAPPPVEVPFSLVDKTSAEVDDDGRGPLPPPCGSERSPCVEAVVWKTSSSPASRAPCAIISADFSPTDSAILSVWTASGTSAGTAPPTDVTVEKGPSPQRPSMLAPLPMESPKLNNAGGSYAAAAAGNGSTGVAHLLPPRLVSEADYNKGDQAVLRRQAASESTSDRSVQLDISAYSEGGSSTSLFQSLMSHHSPRDARLLRRRPVSPESSSSTSALTQVGFPPVNASAEEPDVAHGRASTVAVNGMDFSASCSSLRLRRTTKGSDGVADTRLPSRKSAAANASRTTSFFSSLAQSYPFKSAAVNGPKPPAQSLAPTAVQSTSKHNLVYSAEEHHAEKLRRPCGVTRVPRIQSSRGVDEKKAASNMDGAHTRGNTDRVGALPSATKKRNSGVGRGHDRGVMRVASAVSSRVNEAAAASSSRSAAQELAEMSAQKRQSTPYSRQNPKPRRRTSTPTGGAGTAKGCFRSPELPKPLLVRSSPEASSSLSASDARVLGGEKHVRSRFASPQLPREVRPLPASERVTLLKEIESFGFSVGTPSAVEVLVPVADAPACHRPGRAERDSGTCGGAHGRSKGGARGTASAPAERTAPPPQPSDVQSSNVQPDGDRGEGDSNPRRRLAETRKQFSTNASSFAPLAKWGTVAYGITSASVKHTTGGKVEDDEREQSLQQPPHSSGSPSGRHPRMDVSSLLGPANPHRTNATTDSSNRAAPSLIFRSFRTASSPLKLAAINPSLLGSQKEGAPRQLASVGRHASLSTGGCTLVTTPSEPLASADARRLAPALLRHHHLSTAAGACSPHTPTSRAPDVAFGSSAFSAYSPLVNKSTWSPRLSPRPHQLSGFAAPRASMDPPMVLLPGTRQQRRLSSTPAELSLSEDLFAASPSGSPGLGYRGDENPAPLSPTPTSMTPDILETVVLMETPPANRSTDQQRQQQVPSSGSWSPVLSGTTVVMSNSMKVNSTPSRGLGRASDGSPGRSEEKGLLSSADVVDISTRATSHNNTPELIPAVPTRLLTLDDVLSISNTPPLPRRRSLDARGMANGKSWPSQEKLGPSLAPPQPLLGGANVLSAQQLHAGGGRRKSRLVL